MRFMPHSALDLEKVVLAVKVHKFKAGIIAKLVSGLLRAKDVLDLVAVNCFSTVN